MIWFALLRTAFGQGFINLNFEQALVPPTPVGGPGSFVDPALAFPGWAVSNAVVFDNDLSIGSPAASLIGPLYPNFTGISSLQGSYSVLLHTFGPNYPLGAPALSQTALIPAGTRSIRFVTTGAHPVMHGSF
ncbi:MAG: hypothetical protein DME24_01640 [Verrucomicrobia bacterium]|nr:MAG: hypothetical protein DME24_01640 [Verrucomicrobiota bacterium]